MRKACASALLVVALCAAACESNTQFLDAKQGMAVETAVSRGQIRDELLGSDAECPLAGGRRARYRGTPRLRN